MSSAILFFILLINEVNYHPHKDFIPVVQTAHILFVLGIDPSIPAKTLREFVDYAKARPGKLNYASAGTGSVTHLSGALLLARAGLSMTHVPYKSTVPALVDLVGGQIQMIFGTAMDIIPYMRAGKVTVLGVSSDKRSRELPQVPSIAETYPGFHTGAWYGLFAPAGTPRDIVERLAREVSRFVKEPAVINSMQKTGSDPSGIALEEFAELIRKEEPIWIEAVKAARIKLQ